VADEAWLIVAAARQEPQKGLDVLLAAVPGLVGALPGAVVLVAGRTGRASAALGRQLASLGPAAASVRFLGHRDDVGDLLAAADCFVLPSRREGLPGAVLEAMAAGVPVVASDLATVREAVTPGEAWLVPPGDPGVLAAALATVAGDAAGAAIRVAAARRRFAQRFDIAAVSAAMAAFYDRAMAETRR
jgi:glycosyltransferase involved in cell wall biosynthesis